MIAQEQTTRGRTWEERRETGDGQTIATLLKDLRDDAVLLFRQEINLARGEMAENIRHTSRHLVAMAMGGAIALAGAIVLLMGCASGAAVALAAMGLDPELAVWLGPTLLGGLVLAIGFGLLTAARRRLQTGTLVPKRTVQTLKEDSNWAKEKLNRS
jgi:hypothetical protein